MIKTDILIIGAGPTGLFAVFEAGLLKLKCHLIDALPQPGGQCSEIYPKKPIYDIPAYPEILAGDLTTKLLEQIDSFQPGFTLGERAETIEKLEDNTFIVTTNKGTKHHAPIIAIAGGLGSFEPRKPPIPNIANFEDAGVEYIIRDPEMYRNKKVIINIGWITIKRSMFDSSYPRPVTSPKYSINCTHFQNIWSTVFIYDILFNY